MKQIPMKPEIFFGKLFPSHPLIVWDASLLGNLYAYQNDG
jgi:hypothetical protein